MFLKETKKVHDGIQKVYQFPNGYGASVIKHSYSYGGKENKWELAVLKDGELCYDTDITSDVLGYLNQHEVDSYLTQIEKLEVTNA